MRGWGTVVLVAFVASGGGCLRAQPERADGSAGTGGQWADGGGGAGGQRTDGGAGGQGADGSVGAADGGAIPGSILWARSASSTHLYGVSESSTGLVVTGVISAPVDLGGGWLTPVGATDTVIAQFAANDATHLFSKRFGGGSPPGTSRVYGRMDTVDPAGLPLIHGFSVCNPSGMPACTGVDVGSGVGTAGGGPGADGFVGRFSISAGTAVWSRRLVGPGEEFFTAATIGPNGSVFVTGWFDQDATLLGGSGSLGLTGAGSRDVLIARLNGTTGDVEMTKTFAGPGSEQSSALVWSGSHLIAAGTFSGSTTFGDYTLDSADFDVWVAKLAPSDGAPLWAVRLGGPGWDAYPFVALDAAGDVYVTGTVSGSATFGGFAVGGAGGLDGFVAKLRNEDGSVVWARSFGSSGDDDPAGIAVDARGQILVSGTIAGPIAPGGPFYGGTDAILLSYDGAGTRLWAKVIGTAREDGGSGVTAGREAFFANLILGADIGPTIEGVPIVGAPSPLGVILKLMR